MNQEIIALTIVFFAAAYGVFSVVKTLRTKSTGSCDSGCSCGTKTEIRNMLNKQVKISASELKISK